jgi:hypothetical protein
MYRKEMSINYVMLCNEDNEQLMQAITEQEALFAIKRSLSRKSPGPGGLPKEFYLKTWSIIHSEFTNVLNDALNGSFDKRFTNGTIVLIKKKNRTHLGGA